MPTLEDYQLLVPLNIRQLVEAANAILRPEPDREIQARTVRFYIDQGLLFPPVGGPKFAKYNLEHLRRIVAIRRWLNEGLSLKEVAMNLEEGLHGGDHGMGRRRHSIETPSRQEPQPNESSLSQEVLSKNLGSRRALRKRLTPFTTLEMGLNADVELELRYLRGVFAQLTPEIFMALLDSDDE